MLVLDSVFPHTYEWERFSDINYVWATFGYKMRSTYANLFWNLSIHKKTDLVIKLDRATGLFSGLSINLYSLGLKQSCVFSTHANLERKFGIPIFKRDMWPSEILPETGDPARLLGHILEFENIFQLALVADDLFISWKNETPAILIEAPGGLEFFISHENELLGVKVPNLSADERSHLEQFDKLYFVA